MFKFYSVHQLVFIFHPFCCYFFTAKSGKEDMTDVKQTLQQLQVCWLKY